MPTTSQWQILKTAADQSPSPEEVQSSIATTLKTLDIDDDEEDIFGLKELKSKLADSTSTKYGHFSSANRATAQKRYIEKMRILPGLPRSTRSKLYGLGFRNSEVNLKQNLEKLVEESNLKPDENDTDVIINSLLQKQTALPTKVRNPPKMKPRAVCFNYPGSDITHLQVKRALDQLLINYPEVSMLTIEFQPRCMLLRPDKMENTCRWVVTFTSEWGRNLMTNKQMTLREVGVVLKRYDETVNMEYKQYGRMAEIMKIVKNT